jgi:hypothetical protein
MVGILVFLCVTHGGRDPAQEISRRFGGLWLDEDARGHDEEMWAEADSVDVLP